MLIPAANSADLLKGSLKNVFLINGTGIQQAQAAADFIKAEGSRAVALVDDNTSYSKDITTRRGEPQDRGRDRRQPAVGDRR